MNPQKSAATKSVSKEPTRSARPDAATAEQGQPPHEQAAPPHAESTTPAQRHEDDAAHGYTQDSGYPSSGGAPSDRTKKTDNKEAK